MNRFKILLDKSKDIKIMNEKFKITKNISFSTESKKINESRQQLQRDFALPENKQNDLGYRNIRVTKKDYQCSMSFFIHQLFYVLNFNVDLILGK